MILLIHGEDIINSRKKIDDLIKDIPWVLRFDARMNSVLDIKKGLESQGLFNDKKSIIIENLSSIKIPLQKEILNAIKDSHENSTTVVLWENKKATADFLKKFGDIEIHFFDLPRYFFVFLDNLYPKNSSNVRDYLYRLEYTTPSEQIFYAIIKRIRILLLISAGNTQDFTEIKKLTDWQLKKIQSQANRWNEKKLMEFYYELFELEKGLKTSSLPLSLFAHIDFLIATKLKF